MLGITKSEAELIEAVHAQITSDVSPYKLTNVATALVGYEVRPQVVYSYVRQGFIKAHKNSLGKWVVSRDDARTWIIKYVARNAGKK